MSRPEAHRNRAMKAVIAAVVLSAALALTGESCASGRTGPEATPTAAGLSPSPQSVVSSPTNQPAASPPAQQPPSTDPYPDAKSAGASAVCADGTYSYSAHRSGTCSHHGGVHWWTGNLGPEGPGDH